MKFIINDNKLKIELSDTINSGSFRDYLMEVETDESWQGLSIEAIISKKDSNEGIARAVINNEVYIDMPKKERYTIGFIGYTIENNQKIHQKSTDLKIIPIVKGAGEIEATNTEEIPTQSEWEIYLSLVQEFINNSNNILEQTQNIDVNLDGQVLTITNRNGQRRTIDVKGEKGDSAYTIWLDEGNVGTEQDFLDSLKGADGRNGIDGQNGRDGINGTNGQDGHTPEKNIDYWNASDKAEIVQDTIQDLQPTLNNNLQSAKDYTDNQIARDFKNISYDNNTATFVFTRHDNTTFTVDLPIEQTVKNGYYDDTTEELVLVLVSEQEIRIPASGLIDDYSGQTSATIQCSISADNKITCNIVSGSISKTLLTSELQTEINNKANRSELPSKTSQLTNDSNFTTKTYVDNLFNSIVDGDEVGY